MEAASAPLTRSEVGEWASVAGRAPGLCGLSGRILLRVGGVAVGILQIQESGDVAVIEGEDAHTICVIDTHETLLAMLAGEHDPIVDLLRGHVRIEGDQVFALRVRFGLQAGSPWKSVKPGS